jgi:hypothetical protein
MCGCNLVTPRLIGGDRHSSSGSLAMLGGDVPGFVAGEELGCRAPTGLLLENVGEHLPAGVPHDEARIVVLLDHLVRRTTVGPPLPGHLDAPRERSTCPGRSLGAFP